MDLTRMYRKLCMKEAYGIAVRPIDKPDAPYIAKYPSALQWYADPFVCNDNGKEYVFVELMNHYNVYGQIAVAPIENGVVGDFQIAIDEPFHMSFPNVFQWNGEWYMLPEVFMSGGVRLYRAEEFPYRWSLDTVLVEQVELVDHALFPTDYGFRMVTYDQTDRANMHSRVFRLDMEQRSLKELFPRGNWCRERPGGTFYRKDGIWYHVIQDCVRTYGDFLHVFQVDEFTDEVFSEREIRQVHMGDVSVEPDNGKLEHIHTYNRDSRYETIDFRYWKFYPDKFFLHHWQRFYRRHK